MARSGRSPPGIRAASPIAPAEPVAELDGWFVSARRSHADLRLVDCTPVAKVLVRAPAGGQTAIALGVGQGRTLRDSGGALVLGCAPGEWLLLAAPGTAPEVVARLEAEAGRAGGAAGEPVTVIDVTHGRAIIRVIGAAAAELLSKVCAIDLSDDVTPDGATFRSLVAGVVTLVARDDREGQRSYLLACERDVGQYLFDALLTAGAEFGADVDGFRPPAV